jgi:hypothetical protein
MQTTNVKCPICHTEMENWHTRTTYDKNRKEFDHRRYVCRKDDVWMRVEIPKEKLSEEPVSHERRDAL